MAYFQLSSTQEVYNFMKTRISFLQEEFWAVALNTQLEVLKASCLFRGTVDQCLIHPRDIFRFACKHNSSRLILCHSHPSGNSSPSKEDLQVTENLVAAGVLMDIPIEDHLILAKRNYFSFREHGWPRYLGREAAKFSKI